MTVLLVSDLHLQEERPDITRAFLSFLSETCRGAEALYILGDFFEVWIGDDGMSAFQRSVAEALKRTSERGTRIFVMHGNRDFLLGQQFCKAAGCTLLRDPSLIEWNGQPVLLLHGDSLCTLDEHYQRMRTLLRNPLSLFVLRHLPLATRKRLAAKLRAKSQSAVRMKASDIVDVTPAEVERTCLQHGVRLMIHGHTHRPAIHDFEIAGQPAQRVVLGDWDTQGWAVRLAPDGLSLYPFDLAEPAAGTPL